jgi:hypothetical protein
VTVALRELRFVEVVWLEIGDVRFGRVAAGARMWGERRVVEAILALACAWLVL